MCVHFFWSFNHPWPPLDCYFIHMRSLCLWRSMICWYLNFYLWFSPVRKILRFCRESMCWRVEPSIPNGWCPFPLLTTQWCGMIVVAMFSVSCSCNILSLWGCSRLQFRGDCGKFWPRLPLLLCTTVVGEVALLGMVEYFSCVEDNPKLNLFATCICWPCPLR